MRNVSDEGYRENRKTHFKISKFFPKIDPLSKYIVQSGRPQMTIWRMHIEYWISKAANTDSEYVILIAFPQQQWLQERCSL
jgi:hypothetical protein